MTPFWRRGVAIASLVLAAIGCSPSTDDTMPFVHGVHVPAEYEDCAAAVDKYVNDNRPWAATQYRVTLDEPRDGSTGFLVTYAEDEKAASPGDGESFMVYMSCAAGETVEVLRFQ
jgi:hypothetical protein